MTQRGTFRGDWRVPRSAYGIAALLVALSAVRAEAQSVHSSDLKAAFLYNFVRFTDWPAEVLPQRTPLVLCVAGDDSVANALEATIKGRAIDGRRLTVTRVRSDETPGSCHLLYAGSLDARRARQLLDRIRGTPLFIVSDFDDFARLGGTADLFVEDGKLRFTINVAAAQRARLTINSTLLSLARIVKD